MTMQKIQRFPPLTQIVLRTLFKQQVDDFLAIVERAQIERGAAFIVDVRANHPKVSLFLDAALAGSSTQALAALCELVPAIGEIPGARDFIAALQEQLRNPPPPQKGK